MKSVEVSLNEYQKIPSNSGIYRIKNVLNNKKYIGSTLNFRFRLRKHFYELRKNKHGNIHLQNAFNKYGIKFFKFMILEECEPIKDTLLFIEQKYLDTSPDYNISKIARCVSGDIVAKANRERVWKESSLKLKSDFMKYESEWNKKQRKEVIKFTMDGSFIKVYESITAAAESVGGRNRRINVKRCCYGLSKSAYNHKWQFKNDK